jgi:hypothetical protein
MVTTSERWYITLYPHTWGRGNTPDESKKRARAEGGSGTWWYTYLLPEHARDPYVDQMGRIGWSWPDGYSGDVESQGEIVAHGAAFKPKR